VAYHLGIDLGTTYTAAAVERGGQVEAVTLGNRQVSVPSVLFLKADGEVLVGDAANRRGVTEPERLAREFKRRIGDPTPVLLGGVPYGAEALTGKLLRWVVERVAELEGGPPAAIALTHPANWGPYKLDLLQQGARQANVGVARFLTEPEAAATSYASQERVEPGSIIAVYDLGGGTFDATVLRKREDGFDILGQPEGIERLGGIDFDVAVFNHVWNSLGGALSGLDTDDPAVVAAVSRLRRECVDAKEALSADTDVSIPVVLPNLQTEVRLTRNEFESMIRPALGETVVALRRALDTAQVTPDQVSSVLLVGGSSRIPMVSQLLAGELGRPIAVDANPKDAVCLGAAVAAAQAVGAATPESVTAVASPPVAAATAAAVAAAGAPTQPVEATTVTTGPPPGAPAPPRKGRGGLVAALVGVVALVAAAAFFLTSGGGDDDGGREVATGDATTTTVEADETATTDDAGPATTADPYDRIEGDFVGSCTDAQIADGSIDAANAEAFCRCSFEAIRGAFDFETFEDLNDEAEETGEQPEAIANVVEPCVEQFGS
jgi:molecular chaperone DnaK (HSP70)